MKYLGYKVLLSLLKVLVYLKRGIFWLGGQIFQLGRSLQNLFESTIGFRLYKIQFFLKKRFNPAKNPWTTRILDFLGSRSTLQVVLLFIFLLIMYPHSQLYSADSLSLPGRKTALYQLIGPGDQDYEEVEEVEVETLFQPDTPTWREGAIAYDPAGVTPLSPELQGISGLGPGGTALIKPNILPGANLPTDPSVPGQTPARRGVMEYTVQTGDVIGSIASRFGVSVNTILWANNLSVRSYIRPGDTLKIPPGTGVLHVVKKGESVGKIAQIYNVQGQEIVVANVLQKDGSDLRVGETLFIPGGVKLQPAPAPRALVRQPTSVSRGLDRIAAPLPSVTAPAGSGYIWPTTDRRINQYFGLRHTGVDIGGKVGNANYAANAGRVVKSQCGWNGGYGCYIILDHGGGVTTLYGHNSKLLVSAGETVEQGQVIALLGSTGRSTGPHLHFEVRVGGKKVNPLRYVR